MEEKDIYKVSIIVIIVGLIILAFYVGEVSLEGVARLEELPDAEKIKLKGFVEKVTQNDNVVFLKVRGEEIVVNDVILFDDEPLYVTEGNYVEINGIVEEYKGKKEVIASEIVIK
jgi:aspartyl/asparaginyl-tRNA synthetase